MAYLESDFLADESPPVAVEERLEAPLSDPQTGEDLGIPLVGVLDLITEGGWIVDFKTAARSSQSLDMLHELQLSCYSYLYRQVTGQTESGLEIRSLIKTKSPKVEVQRIEPRRDEHFARLFGVVRAYLDALEHNRFHVRPGFECSFCEFRESACSW
jgi:CRISPR/Cas system-associated exonuclease Cas4 (RecB family)